MEQRGRECGKEGESCEERESINLSGEADVVMGEVCEGTGHNIISSEQTSQQH